MSCGRRRFDDVAGAFDRDDRRRDIDIDADNVFIRANKVIIVEDDRRDRRRSDDDRRDRRRNDDDRRRRNRCPW